MIWMDALSNFRKKMREWKKGPFVLTPVRRNLWLQQTWHLEYELQREKQR